ncbi:MAG: response regulator [Anaerolineae bacterium]|nr:response regulator [Anaerolineae bacterium]
MQRFCQVILCLGVLLLVTPPHIKSIQAADPPSPTVSPDVNPSPWWQASWFRLVISISGFVLATGGSLTFYRRRGRAAEDCRRELEALVAQQATALQENEVKYRDVSEKANDGIAIVQDGLIQYANPQLAQMVGHSVEELLDTHFTEIIVPEKRAVMAARYENRLRGETVPTRYETQLLHRHGAKVEVEVNAGVIEYRGHPAALVIARDITERKRFHAQLIVQQRELATLEERERIGRELHDSLGQILGYINVQIQAARTLLAEDKLTASDQLLQQLVELAQQAHAGVREFILGTQKPARRAGSSPLDFWGALREYAQQFEEQHHIRVLLSLPDQEGQALLLPTAPTKELKLLRIIQEALTNAHKHAHATQVQIIFSRVGDQIQVMVADDGCGFDADTTLTHHGQAGDAHAVSHFGLTIMHERAIEIGGTLTVRSRPGEGTQVMLLYPAPSTASHAQAISEDDTTARSKRVLLVDDHPMFLEGLRNLLIAYGIEVVGLAHDGLEAQGLARSTRPDVIVMDVHMPRCDGLEATRRIKAQLPDVEIIMLTVSAEKETLFKALKAGASGYLLKNMKAEDFFLLISNLDKGAPPIAPELAGKVLAEFQQQRERDPDKELTPRQTEILSFVTQGLTYREIAGRLFISERTVKRQMKDILTQLHLNSRAQAAAYARRRGMGDDPAP